MAADRHVALSVALTARGQLVRWLAAERAAGRLPADEWVQVASQSLTQLDAFANGEAPGGMLRRRGPAP